MVQSSSAHRSERRFSTGVPVRANRARAGMARRARAVCDDGFLTAWASSATTRSQPTSARRLGVAADDAVGGDDQLVVGEVVEGAVGAVVAPHRYLGGEALGLALPVAQQRGRADHQRRPSPLAVVAQQVEGEDLDGLAQAHVVGEDAAQTEGGHLGQPRQAPLLVGAERGVQSVGGPPGLDLVERAEPLGQVPQRTLDLGLDRLAVDGDGARQGGGKHVARPQRRALAEAA